MPDEDLEDLFRVEPLDLPEGFAPGVTQPLTQIDEAIAEVLASARERWQVPAGVICDQFGNLLTRLADLPTLAWDVSAMPDHAHWLHRRLLYWRSAETACRALRARLIVGMVQAEMPPAEAIRLVDDIESAVVECFRLVIETAGDPWSLHGKRDIASIEALHRQEEFRGDRIRPLVWRLNDQAVVMAALYIREKKAAGTRRRPPSPGGAGAHRPHGPTGAPSADGHPAAVQKLRSTAEESARRLARWADGDRPNTAELIELASVLSAVVESIGHLIGSDAEVTAQANEAMNELFEAASPDSPPPGLPDWVPELFQRNQYELIVVLLGGAWAPAERVMRKLGYTRHQEEAFNKLLGRVNAGLTAHAAKIGGQWEVKTRCRGRGTGQREVRLISPDSRPDT